MRTGYNSWEMWLRTSTAVVAAAFLLAGCGGRDDDAAPTTTAADTTTTTAPTSSLVTTTTLDDTSSRCSASDLDPDLAAQEGLPEAVAETRRRIARAAVACDYEALARLAGGGDGASFTYSFGDSGDAATFWERHEESGTGDPMRHLVGVLARPHAVVEAGGISRYAWPSAFTYDSWSAVPEAEREALRPLYDDDDFDSFEQFGGYIGYRALILADGTWTVFVAGD